MNSQLQSVIPTVDPQDARILIVDDDQQMLLLMEHALEREGYTLFSAASGREALREFEARKPDLVLMDAVMPELDGITVCRRIKDLPQNGDVPVLVVTGLDDESAVVRAFEAGAVDFVPKPVNWAVLRQRIRRILATRRVEQGITELAYHDTLTGLPNRRMFLDRLASAVGRADRSGRMVALLFIDLDQFKIVNDTMGHECGDQLLKLVADRLVAGVREIDTVARLGGDEFTVILEGIVDADHVAGIAEKLLSGISRAVTIGSQTIVPRASIGIALCPADGSDISELLKHADIAMYRAKEQGSNRFHFFTQELGSATLRRARIEAALYDAADRNQFRLEYSPRVDIETGKVVTVACLLRWAHPEFDVLTANEFLPAAEATGQSAAIGDWMVRTACAQLAAWHAEGAHEVGISINLSAAYLRSDGLADRISALLAEYRLSPERLEIELNEHVVEQVEDSARDSLAQLCALGVSVCLEDFGVSHTSLLALRRLPISLLKIGAQYIEGVPGDADCAAIATAVAEMARSLGYQRIAEGVGTLEQLAFVRRLGCGCAGGALFGQPVAAEQLSLAPRNLEARLRFAG